MSILVDTNILIRIAEPQHPQNPIAIQSVERLLAVGELLHLVPQNIYEFWVVATRPLDQNGLGMSVEIAAAKIDELLASHLLLSDLPAIFPRWRELVTGHACKGKPAHDARIVAAMNIHGIDRLLTFNVKDFKRFAGITVVDPAELLQSKS